MNSDSDEEMREKYHQEFVRINDLVADRKHRYSILCCFVLHWYEFTNGWFALLCDNPDFNIKEDLIFIDEKMSNVSEKIQDDCIFIFLNDEQKNILEKTSIVSLFGVSCSVFSIFEFFRGITNREDDFERIIYEYVSLVGIYERSIDNLEYYHSCEIKEYSKAIEDTEKVLIDISKRIGSRQRRIFFKDLNFPISPSPIIENPIYRPITSLVTNTIYVKEMKINLPEEVEKQLRELKKFEDENDSMNAPVVYPPDFFDNEEEINIIEKERKSIHNRNLKSSSRNEISRMFKKADMNSSHPLRFKRKYFKKDRISSSSSEEEEETGEEEEEEEKSEKKKEEKIETEEKNEEEEIILDEEEVKMDDSSEMFIQHDSTNVILNDTSNVFSENEQQETQEKDNEDIIPDFGNIDEDEMNQQQNEGFNNKNIDDDDFSEIGGGGYFFSDYNEAPPSQQQPSQQKDNEDDILEFDENKNEDKMIQQDVFQVGSNDNNDLSENGDGGEFFSDDGPSINQSQQQDVFQVGGSDFVSGSRSRIESGRQGRKREEEQIEEKKPRKKVRKRRKYSKFSDIQKSYILRWKAKHQKKKQIWEAFRGKYSDHFEGLKNKQISDQCRTLMKLTEKQKDELKKKTTD